MIRECPYGRDHDTCAFRTKKNTCKVAGNGAACSTVNHLSADEIVEQFKKRILLTGRSLPTQYADMATEEFWNDLGL
jgi:hypothetical protein